jgi:hypothetical protein
MAECATAILDRADLVSRDPARMTASTSQRGCSISMRFSVTIFSRSERGSVYILSAVDGDYDERNVTTILTLT